MKNITIMSVSNPTTIGKTESEQYAFVDLTPKKIKDVKAFLNYKKSQSLEQLLEYRQHQDLKYLLTYKHRQNIKKFLTDDQWQEVKNFLDFKKNQDIKDLLIYKQRENYVLDLNYDLTTHKGRKEFVSDVFFKRDCFWNIKEFNTIVKNGLREFNDLFSKDTLNEIVRRCCELLRVREKQTNEVKNMIDEVKMIRRKK